MYSEKDQLVNPLLTAIFVLFFLILAIQKSVIIGAYAVLCIWALVGARQAVQALSLNYVIILLSPAVYTLPQELTLLRWVILLLAGFRVLLTFSFKTYRYLIALAFFFLMVTVLSWLTSPVFLISFLKIAVFTFCTCTVLIAFGLFDKDNLDTMKTWFVSLTAAVALLSLPTLIIPKIGYFRNGRGFQGILNHPQAFGVFLAPIAAYLVACLLFKKGRKSPWLPGLAGVVGVMILLSHARTAVLTVLLSLGALLVVGIIGSRSWTEWSSSRSLLKIAAVSCVVLVLLGFSSGFSRAFEKFWVKNENKSVEKSFHDSRGGAIAFQWQRFLEQPLMGQGFGIDAAHRNDKKPVTYFGVPVSASSEKGFLPVAFLEEVGILGLLFFLPFAFLLVNGSLATRDVGLIAMFFACLLVNIGESVFFSPGQLGGYLWLLMGLCTAQGWQLKNEV